jgi:2-iminobutanoate/2-iminopropanoate deaminase
MTRQIIRTPHAPTAPATFSQGVKAGGLIFVAGQGPFDPATGDVVGETVQEQIRQSLRNVSAILEAAGSSLAKTVSATVIFAEESDFAGINEEWVRWFPMDPPARHVSMLPVRPKNMKVSVAVVAAA